MCVSFSLRLLPRRAAVNGPFCSPTSPKLWALQPRRGFNAAIVLTPASTSVCVCVCGMDVCLGWRCGADLYTLTVDYLPKYET